MHWDISILYKSVEGLFRLDFKLFMVTENWYYRKFYCYVSGNRLYIFFRMWTAKIATIRYEKSFRVLEIDYLELLFLPWAINEGVRVRGKVIIGFNSNYTMNYNLFKNIR